ncbi:MAG: type II secretion system protein [Candidatus Daviesbacteria bacterium]|nr:type II secretion system protein [Candidatus Daviesbacteria bacterium]
MKKGFTLIELLVVIAILAILATIGMAVFSSVQSKGRDAKRRSDVHEVTKALDVAKGADNAVFPALVDTLFTPGKVPTDPVTGKNYCVTTAASSGAAFATDPTAWATGGCSGSWAVMGNGVPAAGAAKIRVCASLEDTTVSPQVVCSSTQAN